MKYFFILFLIILTFSSCKKKYVAVISPEYEGEWHSSSITNANDTEVEIYFIIDGNKGVLGEWCELVPLGSNCSANFNGDVIFNFNKTKIFIGPRLNRVVLRVDVPPHVNDDGKWECTITSRVYIKN